MNCTAIRAQSTGSAREQAGDMVRRALVVDDSVSQTATISAMMRSWGFHVECARNGAEALEIFRRDPVTFVVSDWNMPGLSGTELCAAMRAMDGSGYIYFILMTSRSHKQDIVEGLNAGADDYLAKPVDPGELLARLNAGERILELQYGLLQRHSEIVLAHAELKRIHEDLEADLALAAKVQMLCQPASFAVCRDVPAAAIYCPCSHVSGDLIGYFEIADDEIAAYAADVSGHGVAAALMSFSLSQTFRTRADTGNIAFAQQPRRPLDPSDVVARLNKRYQSDAESGQYFTTVYARLNTSTGLVRFCQAGHPPPAVIRRDGRVEFAGSGGAPVGLLADVEYLDTTLKLDRGDKLVLYSDGLTDSHVGTGKPLGEDGLHDLLARLADLPVDQFGQAMTREIAGPSGKAVLSDDVSALILARP